MEHEIIFNSLFDMVYPNHNELLVCHKGKKLVFLFIDGMFYCPGCGDDIKQFTEDRRNCTSNFHDDHIRPKYTKVEKCSVCGRF